jgi:hypothetical protein
MSKEVAPKSVQVFRTRVRANHFKRGINATADLIFDELIVWLVDGIFSGRIKTRREAADAVGDWLSCEFPEKKSARLVSR